jgi:predicted metal-dependent phosphoesterase TrpH
LDCSPQASIDLHIHSTASDGTATPREILAMARQAGLKAVSITDHDSLEGIRSAIMCRESAGPRLMTGVEISASPPPQFAIAGSFHLLGYGIRVDHPELNEALAALRHARRNRNPRIFAKLAQLGIELSMDAIVADTADGQLGRPHIAQQMVKKGYVRTLDEAFDRYLGVGKPAYVDKTRIACATAIELILAAGGIPVLAHPFVYESGEPDRIERLVARLTPLGLRGIEVFYPDHSADQTSQYARLARRHGLLVTGGTDYHGALKPDVHIGVGRGDLCVPFSLYHKLEEACRMAATSRDSSA